MGPTNLLAQGPGGQPVPGEDFPGVGAPAEARDLMDEVSARWSYNVEELQ